MYSLCLFCLLEQRRSRGGGLPSGNGQSGIAMVSISSFLLPRRGGASHLHMSIEKKHIINSAIFIGLPRQPSPQAMPSRTPHGHYQRPLSRACRETLALSLSAPAVRRAFKHSTWHYQRPLPREAAIVVILILVLPLHQCFEDIEVTRLEAL